MAQAGDFAALRSLMRTYRTKKTPYGEGVDPITQGPLTIGSAMKTPCCRQPVHREEFKRSVRESGHCCLCRDTEKISRHYQQLHINIQGEEQNPLLGFVRSKEGPLREFHRLNRIIERDQNLRIPANEKLLAKKLLLENRLQAIDAQILAHLGKTRDLQGALLERWC